MWLGVYLLRCCCLTTLCPSELDQEKVPLSCLSPRQRPLWGKIPTPLLPGTRAAHGGTFQDVWASRGSCVPVEGGEGPQDTPIPALLGPYLCRVDKLSLPSRPMSYLVRVQQGSWLTYGSPRLSNHHPSGTCQQPAGCN